MYVTNAVLECVTKFIYVSGYRVTRDAYAPAEVGYHPADGEEIFDMIAAHGTTMLKCGETAVVVLS